MPYSAAASVRTALQLQVPLQHSASPPAIGLSREIPQFSRGQPSLIPGKAGMGLDLCPPVQRTYLLAAVAAPHQRAGAQQRLLLRRQAPFFLGYSGKTAPPTAPPSCRFPADTARGTGGRAGAAVEQPAAGPAGGSGRTISVTMAAMNTQEPYTGWISRPLSPMQPRPERAAARTSGKGELSTKGSKR